MIPNDEATLPSAVKRYWGVSFVIPAHNEQQYLELTVKQIRSAAEALIDQYEIIVVNDASTDRTPQLAQSLATRVIDVKLRNIGAVRNAGAAQAKFDWIIFVDADTLVPEKTLSAALRALSRGAVGGGAFVRLDESRAIPWFKMMLYFMVSFFWQTVGRWAAGCFMFCQRDAFWEFGGFDEQFFAAEELFFSCSLKKIGKFQLVREPVITSARKFHGYSFWQLLSFLILPMSASLSGSPLQSRFGLDLLYEDER